MIVKHNYEIKCPPLFFDLEGFVPQSSCFLKLEGLNIAQSVKLTTALGLVLALEEKSLITPSSVLVESSSGNLGVALSLICKQRKYPFICVTDPNILPHNEKLMRLYGATIIKINEKDENGGYLANRIRLIQKMISENSNYIWLNQYANPANPLAHFSVTAEEIHNQFPSIDYLFIGAGTTGTLMGCARYFKEISPQTKIIAVDAMGSVTFGFPSKKRFIPGLGTSRRPEIVDPNLIDDIVLVEEIETIGMCNEILQRYGILVGGSTGTVLKGILKYIRPADNHSVIVAISPDFGDKYIDTLYDENWVHEKFGTEIMSRPAGLHE